jgi:hypothetical protein
VRDDSLIVGGDRNDAVAVAIVDGCTKVGHRVEVDAGPEEPECTGVFGQ